MYSLYCIVLHKEGTVDALLNSVLGSFFNKNIISDLIEPLFELTNNPEVSDFIDSKIKLNPIDISKMFGKGIDGHNRFIKDFKKAIPNYIYQNYRSNFVDGKGNIVSLPTEYNGYTVKEKKGVKNGVEIDNKILYVDSEALKNDFEIITNGRKSQQLSNTNTLIGDVNQLFIEYHSTAKENQSLGNILSILSHSGFHYYIKTENKRNHPFVNRHENKTYDLQLNIFAYKK